MYFRLHTSHHYNNGLFIRYLYRELLKRDFTDFTYKKGFLDELIITITELDQ